MKHEDPVALADLMALLNIEARPGDETRVSAFLQAQMRELGIPADAISIDNAQQQSEYGGSTGNLVVRIDGKRGGPRRMFSAHMDTVPDAVGAKPAIEGTRIVNRAPDRALGGDDRTGCAALLQIARTLAKLNGAHPPTTLVFCVQEEVGLIGSRGLDLTLLGTPAPSYCVNLDSSLVDEVITSVIGTERFNINIEGIAAHAGANPEHGVSAAVVAALAISDLVRNGWHGAIKKTDGEGSANTGIINGGTGSNVVMPALHILAEARSHQRSFRDKISAEWRAAFTRAAEQVQDASGRKAAVRFSPGPSYESFAMKDSEPVVRDVVAALAALDIRARTVTNNGGMDANNIVAKGIPTVTIGTGQSRVHTSHESIDLDRFFTACRFATKLAATPFQ